MEKCAVHRDSTIAELLFVFSEKLKLTYYLVPSMDMSVAELYNLHKDEDGFLYITYASTQMFGSQ